MFLPSAEGKTRRKAKNSIPHLIELVSAKKGFPCGSAGKGFARSVEDLGLIPCLGRSPGEGKGYPLQYSCLENFMECRLHGVAETVTAEGLSLFSVNYVAFLHFFLFGVTLVHCFLQNVMNLCLWFFRHSYYSPGRGKKVKDCMHAC